MRESKKEKNEQLNLQMRIAKDLGGCVGCWSPLDPKHLGEVQRNYRARIQSLVQSKHNEVERDRIMEW